MAGPKPVNTNEYTEFQDSFSEEVWQSTYKSHADDDVNDTMKRVARFVAEAEETDELKQYWFNQFYDILTNFKATTGGRIYSNAGTEWTGTTLMNCFVSPRADTDIDSLSNIIHNLHNQTQTLKSEGGWGENFSYIRPRGAFIHGIGVESPGAVKYMEVFDSASDIITAGSGKKSTNTRAKGKIRKGAMMGVLDCWHPDVIEFITAKQQPGRLSKFNISVNISDEFMEALTRVNTLRENGASEEEINEADVWNLRFPDTTFDKYKTQWSGDIKLWEEKGYPTTVYNTISVTWLWNLIMESTYNRAEPGVLFLDRANHFAPLNYSETIYATNPCGEQMLAPGGVCNLGSINLTQFVLDDGSGFDIKALIKYTKILVRMLDNINTMSQAPLPEYVDSMRNKRRIGCGILGWGSALYMLKVRFGSDRASELREQVMSTIAQEAYKASIDIAVEKGMFKYCEPEKHAENVFVKSLELPDEYMEKLRTTGIRNSSVLSIQPTGNCVPASSVVQLMDGETTISELISTVTDIDQLSEGDVVQLDNEIQIPTIEGVDVFDRIYVNGTQPIQQLNLASGIELKSTQNHRYLVKIDENTADWVQADNIVPGMKVIQLVD